MLVANALLAVALASVCWGIVSSLVIADALHKRGVKVNWMFLRVLMIKYIGQYKAMTRAENGQAGPWYYSFIIAMNLALVTAIVGLVLRLG